MLDPSRLCGGEAESGTVSGGDTRPRHTHTHTLTHTHTHTHTHSQPVARVGVGGRVLDLVD